MSSVERIGRRKSGHCHGGISGVIVAHRMRAGLYLVLLFFLLALLPWVFPTGYMGRVFGFPVWAVYSPFVSIVCPGIVSIFVCRFWDAGEGEVGSSD